MLFWLSILIGVQFGAPVQAARSLKNVGSKAAAAMAGAARPSSGGLQQQRTLIAVPVVTKADLVFGRAGNAVSRGREPEKTACGGVRIQLQYARRSLPGAKLGALPRRHYHDAGPEILRGEATALDT